MFSYVIRIVSFFAITSTVWVFDEGLYASANQNNIIFLSDIEDVPLIEGLNEDKTLAFDFDKIDGRIVEAHAYGNLRVNEVSDFYSDILPELGWLIVNDLIFVRDGEILRIELSKEGKLLLARFVLTPEVSQ